MYVVWAEGSTTLRPLWPKYGLAEERRATGILGKSAEYTNIAVAHIRAGGAAAQVPPFRVTAMSKHLQLGWRNSIRCAVPSP